MASCPVVGVRLVREGRVNYGDCMTGSQAVAIASQFLLDRSRESFLVLCLNAKAKVTAVHECHVGGLSTCMVGVREVFQAAILANACMIVVAHNHPSGDPTPSPEDRCTTGQLVQAGKLLGIDVVDHLVIGDGCHVSMKDRGMM